jgi:hypothetical protein
MLATRLATFAFLDTFAIVNDLWGQIKAFLWNPQFLPQSSLNQQLFNFSVYSHLLQYGVEFLQLHTVG